MMRPPVTCSNLLKRQWLASVCALSLVACATPPVERFHTLQPLSPPTLTPPPTAAVSAEFSVAIGPASLSASLDRPNWVIRTSATEVQILEQHRWAQPLSSEIPEAIATQLNQQRKLTGLAYAETSSATPAYPRKPTVRVQLEVLRFDSWLTPTPRIDDQLQWTVSCTGRLMDRQERLQRTGLFTTSGSTPQTTTTKAQEELPSTPYEKLVTAHATALALASLEIANAVQTLSAQCPKTP